VYHAGLTREQRTQGQERFMQGDAEIVVATNAFGMGVDKPDIRAVIHFNLPGSIEAYYQEVGRAGRDGLSSLCLLLHSSSDRFLQEMFIENEYPSRAAIYQVYEFLRGRDEDPIELTHAQIREGSGVDLNESAVGSILKILDKFEAIEKFLPRENMAIIRFNTDPDEPGPGSASLAERLKPQAQVQRTVLRALEGLVRGRVGEPVYFRPDELAEALGMDRPALTRALRSLSAELPVDYVPPFRGNAIRVMDRTRKPRDLKIDFSGLETRKRHEYAKLEKMVGYTRSGQCRRSYVLEYFGESRPQAEHCGGCDNCRPHESRGPTGAAGARKNIAIDTPQGWEIILKILSGVARAKGRFGKATVAQMLTGSDSERMFRWRLDQLSTYGILRETGLTQKEVGEILDALVGAGLVEAQDVDRFKPVIMLTEAGWTWLRNRPQSALTLQLPEDLLERICARGQARPPVPIVLDDTETSLDGTGPPEVTGPRDRSGPGAGTASLPEDALRDRLRALRSAWARELRQPAYCIFTNETLEELVRSRPATPAALSAIKGLGRSRVERHGGALLEAIASLPRADVAKPCAEEQALQEETGPPQPHGPAQASPGHVTTEEWTYRLIERGFTVEEAAAIRGLEASIIARHLLWMLRRGLAVPVDSLVSPETLACWEAWRAAHGDSTPPAEPPGSASLWPLFVEARARVD
jgi:ATP-dependent DNA helicase RecQ